MAALTFFIRRLFLRAAVFLWMMPLDGSHVDSLHGEAHGVVVVVGADRVVGALGARLELALDGLVALVALRVGENALLLALDVRHGLVLSVDRGVRGPDAPLNSLATLSGAFHQRQRADMSGNVPR